MIGMVTYYRVTLALPLAVTGLVYVVGREAGLAALKFGEVAWYSMLLGGLPYLLLAAFIFFWIRGRSERSVHRVIYLSPFFMTVLLAISIAAFFPALHGAVGGSRDLRDAVARHSLFTLVLGYLYVAAVQLTYLTLKALRRITPE